MRLFYRVHTYEPRIADHTKDLFFDEDTTPKTIEVFLELERDGQVYWEPISNISVYHFSLMFDEQIVASVLSGNSLRQDATASIIKLSHPRI